MVRPVFLYTYFKMSLGDFLIAIIPFVLISFGLIAIHIVKKQDEKINRIERSYCSFLQCLHLDRQHNLGRIAVSEFVAVPQQDSDQQKDPKRGFYVM